MLDRKAVAPGDAIKKQLDLTMILKLAEERYLEQSQQLEAVALSKRKEKSGRGTRRSNRPVSQIAD